MGNACCAGADVSEDDFEAPPCAQPRPPPSAAAAAASGAASEASAASSSRVKAPPGRPPPPRQQQQQLEEAIPPQQQEPETRRRVQVAEQQPQVAPSMQQEATVVSAAAAAAEESESEDEEQVIKEWTISVERTRGKALGLETLLEEGVLFIEGVNDGGTLADWNKDHPAEAIQEGDEIVKINDKSEARDLMFEFTDAKELVMQVIRAKGALKEMQKFKEEAKEYEQVIKEWTISVKRTPGKALGLHVDCIEATRLYIKGVNGGTVGDWNEDHPAEAIQEGDLVVKVNGKSGQVVTSEGLYQECKTAQELVMEVMRLSTEGLQRRKEQLPGQRAWNR